jgi:NADPH:quinone reductase-like Zn-dependent oxidoreductase
MNIFQAINSEEEYHEVYIQYSQHGGDYASTLQCIETEAPPPDPPANFALVKIHVAAGNPIDFKVAKGELNGAWECPLPMIMGYDFSGVIVGLGGGNDGEFQVGDEVFAVTWGQVIHLLR